MTYDAEFMAEARAAAAEVHEQGLALIQAQIEIERQRVWSDEDEKDAEDAQRLAERIVATYSRQAITEAHECHAHMDALAGEIGFVLLGHDGYEVLGIDALVRAARIAIIAREFSGQVA